MTIATVAIAGLVAWVFVPESPERLRDRAEATSRSGEWGKALEMWRAVNRTRLAGGRTYLAEARACLALNRAAQAERALRKSIATDPGDPEPWRLILELLRVEDRIPEAQEVGWEAYTAVSPSARRGILRDLTLALLADLPEDLARELLDRWVAADPDDVDARVAQLRRAAASPRTGDPDRASRIATLSSMLDRNPDQLNAREALAGTLAEAGEPDRGRQILDAWPTSARNDPRYERLRGRWDLDFDRQPARAVDAFRRVMAILPHDWKTQYRLARAFQNLGWTAEARRAAETVGRLRENLDPATLGPRLGAALSHLDEPRSLTDLADLSARVGLTRLADAWRLEAASSPAPTGLGLPDLGILKVPSTTRVNPR